MVPSEVLPPEQLLEYTMDVALRLVRTPAALLKLVKDNLERGRGRGSTAALPVRP